MVFSLLAKDCASPTLRRNCFCGEGRADAMIAETICQLARRIMQHPAAPYHENAVRDEVERICAEHDLPFERDQFGNVLVRWRTAARQRPLVLAAHLDHPGFEVIRGLSSNAWSA